MAKAELTYRAADGAAHIGIDNRARRNAMTLGMWRSVGDLVARAAADDAVRVIVLRGAGGEAFCAGADISEFAEVRTGDNVLRYGEAVAAAEQALAHVEKPTLAVIEGICFGGGMALAMSCDLRLAADNARFRIPAARLGLGYSYAAVAALAGKLGRDAVADILFTARILAAAEAGRLGIARVVPAADLNAEAAETIAAIAENAPLTMRAVKRALVELGKPESHRDAARAEAAVAACFDSADYREGRTAFLEKRKPRFQGV
jgi:enoyl-CoA hydratase/carnithine racemase